MENTSKYGFSPDLGEKNCGVLSMRMEVMLDSLFARPGSAPIGGGKKREFRDWTRSRHVGAHQLCTNIAAEKYCKHLELTLAI